MTGDMAAVLAELARLRDRLDHAEARMKAQDEAWAVMREIGDRREAGQAVDAAQALPRHGLQALPGGVA